MIAILHTLGLTDWSSFTWGVAVMFAVCVIITGLISWACHNAPTMEECENEHRGDTASDPGCQEEKV